MRLRQTIVRIVSVIGIVALASVPIANGSILGVWFTGTGQLTYYLYAEVYAEGSDIDVDFGTVNGAGSSTVSAVSSGPTSYAKAKTHCNWEMRTSGEFVGLTKLEFISTNPPYLVSPPPVGIHDREIWGAPRLESINNIEVELTGTATLHTEVPGGIGIVTPLLTGIAAGLNGSGGGNPDVDSDAIWIYVTGSMSFSTGVTVVFDESGMSATDSNGNPVTTPLILHDGDEMSYSFQLSVWAE